MKQVLKIVIFIALLGCFFALAGTVMPEYAAGSKRSRGQLRMSWILGLVCFASGASLGIWGDVYARYRDELASPTGYRIIGAIFALLGLGWAVGLKSVIEWSAK